ncbi:hypothetical protein NIES4101_50180 [Calothrix sp. NIES-4101]|nr:hypothetical protein NIES4101_50180 [Calothrix sp. NIES-4101]
MTERSPTWYIIKQSTGNCEIVSSKQDINNQDMIEKWGPFDSQGDAIARRIGLIRAGKCQPK